MADTAKEERIRERAYAIWEQQGRPEGGREEHWEQARREIEAEGDGAQGLRDTVTETIGLAVGADPTEAREIPAGTHPSEPAEGDSDTINRELARKKTSPKSGAKATSKTGGVPRSRKAKPS